MEFLSHTYDWGIHKFLKIHLNNCAPTVFDFLYMAVRVILKRAEGSISVHICITALKIIGLQHGNGDRVKHHIEI